MPYQCRSACGDAADPTEKRRQAEVWCDKFEEKNRKWLKTTIATFDAAGEPTLSYEDVDTTIIPPRPRLYGLVGAEVIEHRTMDFVGEKRIDLLLIPDDAAEKILTVKDAIAFIEKQAA